jgi:glycosyltransferase involved in cell wall biosynthesis
MKSSQLSIIICTRNRPTLLANLLFSIEKSFLIPREIVVISSGEEITQTVKLFSHSLTIKHFHTELVGQSNQKKLAFQFLDDESQWVFFLDDDLLLMPNTINLILQKIDQINGKNIAGIGTQIMPLNKASTRNKIIKTSISKKRLGKILKSGRAVPYQSQIATSTEWLNGASIWKKEVLQKYQLPILDSKYAAYEDVIFSTEVNRSYELIYDPEIKIREQICHNKLQPNLSAFKYINFRVSVSVFHPVSTKGE